MGAIPFELIPQYLGVISLGVLALGSLYTLWTVIYNLYFSPLARFPGPFLAKISPVRLQPFSSIFLSSLFSLAVFCLTPTTLDLLHLWSLPWSVAV